MMGDGEDIAVIGSESGLREPERRRGLRVWMSRVQSIQYPLALAVGSMLITSLETPAPASSAML